MNFNEFNTASGAGSRDDTRENYQCKKGVAEHYRVTTRTIDDWMKQGRIPFYKIGRTVRFKVSEVDAHIAKSCRVALRNNPCN